MTTRIVGHHASGSIDRDGVRIHYDVHGEGEPPLLLLPAWAIATSAIWDQQVAHFASRRRVVTYDPRGNGRSDRPLDPAAHDPLVLAGDAVAVLDAAGVERAVVVGNSFGTVLAYLLAALHPERVAGAVFIDPSSLNLDGRIDDPFQRAVHHFLDEPTGTDGWARFNRQSWARDYDGFVRWFVSQVFPEPDADEARANGVLSGSAIAPAELAATIVGRLGSPPAETAARLRALGARIECPTAVVQGELDAIAPRHRAETLASLLDAPLTVVEGAGHCPQVTRPEAVHRVIEEVLARSGGSAPMHP